MALTKVSTDGVKDDAITKTKIPANQIEASELADNAVDTNAIADQAVALSKLPHGTSSNDGKFLRANNGADPTFVSVTGTTINNNADNRIITGSGTANTLEAESVLTFDSSTDTLQVHQQNAGNNPAFKSIHRGGSGSNINAHFTNYSGTSNTVILHDGKVGINTTSPIGSLDVYDGTLVLSKPNSSGNERNWRFLNNNVAAGNLGLQCSTAAGGSTFSNIIEIESNGNIGIGGQTNPTTNFHIKDKTTHGYELRLSGNALTLNRNGTAYINQEGTGSGADLSFRMGNPASEKIRILNGGGITFNGDTAAANAILDYEEGTHTLVPNSNITLHSSYNVGEYTKVGNVVTFNFLFFITAVSSNNTVSVTLPFQNRSGSGSSRCDAVGSVMHNKVNTGSAGVVPFISNGGSTVLFYNLSTNGSWAALNNSDLNANDEMYVSITYRAA